MTKLTVAYYFGDVLDSPQRTVSVAQERDCVPVLSSI